LFYAGLVGDSIDRSKAREIIEKRTAVIDEMVKGEEGALITSGEYGLF